MKDYLLWVSRQYYLLFFWPSRLEKERREIQKTPDRSPRMRGFLYALKLLPWVPILAAIGILLAGCLAFLVQHEFNWSAAFLWMPAFAMYGFMFGIAFGIEFGVVFSVAFGFALGVVEGIGEFSGIAEPGVCIGILVGLVPGAALGLVPGAALGFGRGLIRGIAGAAGSAAFAAAVAGVVRLFVDYEWSVFGYIVAGFFAFGLLLGIPTGIALGTARSAVRGIVGGVALGFVAGILPSMAIVIALASSGDYKSDELERIDLAVLLFCVSLPVGFCLTFFRFGTFPVDALLSMLMYLRARARPDQAFWCWRRCPIVWNEIIYAALPGAAKLLALATRQNRDVGFRQIAFVAAERPLQRRVAVEALSEIVLGDLAARTATDIASAPDRMSWTATAPLAFSEDSASALFRFERIGRQVAQSVAVVSTVHKADSLRRAIEELDLLRKTLVASADRLSPRLLQVANRWREALDAEESRLKELAAVRHEIPNPFIFGNPVDERNTSLFAGRQDVARQIEESLLGARQSPALLLHGPRRVGKSSILKQLPRLLGPDFAPAMLDCQNPAVAGGEASTASLLRYLSAALSEGLQRRRVEAKPLTAEALAREPFAAFDAWLGRVDQAMPSAMRALLCLDEYERLQRALDAGWGGDFLDALRHTLQHRPRFVLLFTGAHTFAEMGPAWTDRFISARRVRVSFLHPDDVRPLLTKPIPEFDLTYAPGAVDAVIAATRCQPFLVQAVAFELVQYLNEQQRKEAGPADVETAVARALESGGEYFANVWSDARPEGQAILREIVRSGVAADVRRLQSTRNAELGTRNEDQSLPTSAATGARKWLREHDVLDDAGKFAVPMMERWVREQKSD